MKIKTYKALSAVPFIGPIITMLCDPLLSCSPAMDDGLPKQVTDFIKAHPDTFITKRLLKEIMDGRK